MNRQAFLILFAALLLLLASCTAEHVSIEQCVSAEPDGFWQGLWHGIIAPVTFVFSLFSDSMEMYSVNNNGGWYNFGFVLGAGILFGGGSRVKK
jgi:hypothetical protein